MSVSQNCVFAIASEDDAWAVVVCSRCGIKAKVPVDNAKNGMVYSICKNPSGEPAIPPPPPPANGPGTELSRLLKRFGIEPTPTCQCRAKAAQMNVWGCDECSRPERIEEVVAVMRAEAQARGLPFLDAAGRLLVRRAIQNARKAAKTDAP